MAARKQKTRLVARETFAVNVDGEQLVVVAGQTVDSEHAAVKGREELFAPADRTDH